jgi:hypothetical protein
MDEQQSTVALELTAAELELLRTALGLLEATLGREEADELEQVQSILAKVDHLRAR